MQRCVKDRNSKNLDSLEYKIYNVGQSRTNVKNSGYLQIIVQGVSFQFRYLIFLVEASRIIYLRNDHMSCCQVILECVYEKTSFDGPFRSTKRHEVVKNGQNLFGSFKRYLCQKMDQ